MAADYFDHHFQERLTLQFLAKLWEQLPTEKRSELVKKYSSSAKSTAEHVDSPVEGSKREIVQSRPNWTELLPKGGDEEAQRNWQEVLAELPDPIATELIALQQSRAIQDRILDNAEAKELISDKQREKIEVVRTASLYGAIKREAAKHRVEADSIINQSVQFDTPLSATQRQAVAQLENYAEQLDTHAEKFVSAEVANEILRRQILADRMALRRGLLETDQVRDIKSKYLGSLIAGMPMLLVGETGGAKTQIAKHLARELNSELNPDQNENNSEPYELISGHNDINSYQIMGKMELSREEGVTVTNFAPGPMLRAMREGHPLIIDEINAISPDVLKRLNELFLLRPGQRLKVQENGGELIEIAEGFCIISTANDKSTRYKGIEDLSVEFKNRFGPRVERISYPDSEKDLVQFPTELFRLAVATLADKYGNINFEQLGLTAEELVRFVRLAHRSQSLFSNQAMSSDSQFVSDRQINDGKTGLDQEVISPRVMVEYLSTLVRSGGKRNLTEMLQTYLQSIKPDSRGVTNDKAVMGKLIEYFGFTP